MSGAEHGKLVSGGLHPLPVYNSLEFTDVKSLKTHIKTPSTIKSMVILSFYYMCKIIKLFLGCGMLLKDERFKRKKTWARIIKNGSGLKPEP
jgi:hypothetical protein